MFLSVQAADAYIKANIQYYHKVVGNGARKRVLDEMSERMTPDQWNVPNH
jgi:hypothetical protein